MTLDPDLALVCGLGLVLLSTLSLVSAWIDKRRPVVGSAVLLLGLVLMTAAFVLSPSGYSAGGLPEVIFIVLGRYVL